MLDTLRDLSHQLRLEQGPEKFLHLEKLAQLVQSLSLKGQEIAELSRTKADLWPEEIRETLYLLLSSKISENNFGHVFSIASNLWNWFGNDWVKGLYWRAHCKAAPLPLPASEPGNEDLLLLLAKASRYVTEGDKQCKLPELLIHFAEVEISMRLVPIVDAKNPPHDQDDLDHHPPEPEKQTEAEESEEHSLPHYSVLLSSFSIIESTIGLLIEEIEAQEESGDSERDHAAWTISISPDAIFRYHKIFKEVFLIILEFIEKNSLLTELSDPLVIAASQLLGVWIRDDFQQPEQVITKIAQVLPYIINLQIQTQSSSGSVCYFIAPLLSGFHLILQDFYPLVKPLLEENNRVKALTLLWKKSITFMAQFDGSESISLAISELAQILILLYEDPDFSLDVAPLHSEILLCLDLEHDNIEMEDF